MTQSIRSKYPENVYITDVLVGPHQTPEQGGTDEWTIVVEVVEYDSITSEPTLYEDAVVGPFAVVTNIIPNRTHRLYWNEDSDE
jgi:hypothetical protein